MLNLIKFLNDISQITILKNINNIAIAISISIYIVKKFIEYCYNVYKRFSIIRKEIKNLEKLKISIAKDVELETPFGEKSFTTPSNLYSYNKICVQLYSDKISYNDISVPQIRLNIININNGYKSLISNCTDISNKFIENINRFISIRNVYIELFNNTRDISRGNELIVRLDNLTNVLNWVGDIKENSNNRVTIIKIDGIFRCFYKEDMIKYKSIIFITDLMIDFNNYIIQNIDDISKYSIFSNFISNLSKLDDSIKTLSSYNQLYEDLRTSRFTQMNIYRNELLEVGRNIDSLIFSMKYDVIKYRFLNLN